jgi:PAS domain S-box-containing protein
MAASPCPQEARPAAPAASILLVDDQPANLLALRALLEDLGQELVEAQSGAEACQRLESHEFAVVLLDVVMPGIDGFETARRIRADARTCHTPIIFVTAHDVDRARLEEGYSLGAVDFLVKPLLATVVRAKVCGFVELFQEKQRTRQQAEQLRLLVDGTNEYAIFMLDPQGRVVTWNSGAERLKGYRAQEIVGQHFSQFYPQEAIERDWPAHELRVAQAEGRFEDEGWRVRQDGSQFWANVVITALRDAAGNLRGFSKVTRDMTERKRAEENARRLVAETTARRVAEENARVIQEQRERLRVTLASIGDAVISTDAEGKVTFLNAVAEGLVGWKADEAMQRALPEVFRIINEQTRQPVENPALRALREGIIVALANDSVLMARDGRERPIDDSAAPIRDVDGQVIGSVLVFRDISERRAAQQRLRDSEQRYRRLYQALREANRRKDEFLATLAHELRNPLAPLRNSLEILKIPGADTDTIARARAMMERQLHHLVRLVDDLLDVSRVMRGKIELRRERIELAAVVARAVETVQPLIDAERHQLEVRVPAATLGLQADPVRLAQVVANLLANAAKYTEPGGRIDVSAERDGAQALLRVRDNGIGIASDMLSRIFELFVQASAVNARTQGGLGIGLTLVKNLVEMHDGSVEAHSQGLGQGSEFVVRLPLAPAQVDPAPNAAPPDTPPPSSGFRLLVVDDNQDAATSLALLLRFQGHEARVAFSGAEALALTNDYTPDAVLLDIGMPGMDGFETARRLRQQPGLEGTVLAALTGWGQNEDRRRTAAAGFDLHLVKPPEPQALAGLLAEVKARKGN